MGTNSMWGQPARFATDADGNVTGLLDSANLTHGLIGTNTLTVGPGGKYSTLADAIAARNSLYPHTLVKTTTVTVTGTSGGTISIDKFTLASGITYSDYTTLYGIRIGGSSNPIIPCRFFSSTVGYAEYPFLDDYAGATAEIFELTYANIVLLPGTKLVFDGGTIADLHTLPGFTTISALIPGTAEIVKESGNAAYKIFFADASSNKCRITGLRLTDNYRKINSIFFELGAGGQVALCDVQIDNCDIVTASNDFIYTISEGSIGFTAINNRIRGTYDVFRLGTHRRVVIQNNLIEVVSNVAGDGESATGVVLGSNNAAAWNYHTQLHIVKDNVMRIFSQVNTGNVDAFATAIGVGIRQGVHANNQFIVSGNVIEAEIKSDIAVTTYAYPYSAAAVVIQSSVGAAAADFIMTNNMVRARVTGTNTTNVPAALIAYSGVATCPVKMAGNTVFGGGATAKGGTTSALTTY